MPNVIYPRTVTITRAQATYTDADGLTNADVTVAQNVDCSIQIKRETAHPSLMFPVASDTDASVPFWVGFIPAYTGLTAAAVKKGDKVTDDLGNDYQVESAYPNFLGLQLSLRAYKP